MGLSVKIRWFLLVSIIIMGIAYKPLALLLIPLLIYRETRDWLIDGLYSLIFPGLAPRLEVFEDYVFDYRNNVAHVFYTAEPLFDISRLSGQQYVNLVNEFVRRLSLMPNEAFAFIRLGDNKYVRLSRKVEPTETGLSEFTNWVRSKEVLLRQYFILTPVTGSGLRRLVGFPRNPSMARLIAVLAILDFLAFLFMGIYGLAALIILNTLAIMARSNYSVIKGGELSKLSHRLSASGLLFTKPSEEDLRSIAEAFVSNSSNFMLSISGNPGFRGEVSRTVVSSHTKLIVHENPKAIPKASQWSIVLERINERGEEPVKAMLALDRQSTVPLLFTTRTTTQMHLWSMPSIDELGYDLAVIPIFHGGRVLSESLRARVYLGKDRENNELWVDLDSMPSGFGLVVGPTGMGKTWSVSTLLYRLMRSGISDLVVKKCGNNIVLELSTTNSVDAIFFPVLLNMARTPGLKIEWKRVAPTAKYVRKAIALGYYVDLGIGDRPWPIKLNADELKRILDGFSDEELAMFVSGLLDGDGSVWYDYNSSVYVKISAYKACPKRMVLGILRGIIAKRFGIIGRIYPLNNSDVLMFYDESAVRLLRLIRPFVHHPLRRLRIKLILAYYDGKISKDEFMKLYEQTKYELGAPDVKRNNALEILTRAAPQTHTHGESRHKKLHGPPSIN